MELEFYTLDVFTDQRFAGNPLAVVLKADGLSSEQMLAITREFNLSETVFVLEPDNPAHSARIRIFTPASEMPFAGHPTVGTAALLAELRAEQVGGSSALVALEEQIGLVRVGVRMNDNGATFAEFDAPKIPEEVGIVASRDDLAAGLGLMPGEIGFANHRPTCFNSGPVFTFVPVSSIDAVGRAAPNMAHWEAGFGGAGGGAAFLYCPETVHTFCDYHARMFAPGHGVMEDPATGSAAVGFAGVIAKFDQPPSGTHKKQIEQGLEMGRPSFITLAVEMRGSELSNVRIGGSAVRVSHGHIRI